MPWRPGAAVSCNLSLPPPLSPLSLPLSPSPSLLFVLPPCSIADSPTNPLTYSSALGDLIGRIEVLLVRVGECEGVLEEGEGWMTESGPIGADLDRLVEQQEILDVSIYMYCIYCRTCFSSCAKQEYILQALDEELLNKKKIPEEVMNEAMNIIKDCREGSGESLMSRVRGLQNRFDQLVENCYESRELCEEATAAMQVVTPHTSHFHPYSVPLHTFTPHSSPCHPSLFTLLPLTLHPVTPHSSPCHPSPSHSSPCHPSLTLSLSPLVLPDQGDSVH